MIVSTDDNARGLRFPWKGPKSAPFGFEVRFPVAGTFVGLTVAGWVVVGFLAPTLLIGLLLAAAVPYGAYKVVKKYAPLLTPDTPIAYYVEVGRHELTAPRPPQPRKKRRTIR